MASALSEDSIVSNFANELVDETVGETGRKWALLILLVLAVLVAGGIGASRFRNR